MGGTNSETINGLRFHISNGEVHVHDDTKSLKFVMDSKKFKDNVESAVSQMSKAKNDGMIRIAGDTKCDLCLVREGKVIFSFLTDTRSIKSKLLSFTKGC